MLPKNILMIGPTGVGKTEISRRLARLADAPFLKVEATKFTEVGYVGRDVEQIVRDLVEIAIALMRERKRKDVRAKAEQRPRSACSTRWSARRQPGDARELPQEAARRRARRQGDRDRGAARLRPACRCSKSPACRARRSASSRSAIFSARRSAARTKTRRVTVAELHDLLIAEETDKLLDKEALVQEAIARGREQRHRLPRRDRQDLRARGPRPATSPAKACSATCCR